jgi:hypothetical protein
MQHAYRGTVEICFGPCRQRGVRQIVLKKTTFAENGKERSLAAPVDLIYKRLIRSCIRWAGHAAPIVSPSKAERLPLAIGQANSRMGAVLQV